MRKKNKTKLLLITAITTAITFSGAISYTSGLHLKEAKAATQNKEIVDLRIVNTTDIHGQLNSKDYEQGVDYNNGGLARVFDLIQKTRGELPKENTFTLDNGDVLYDYTTEYIFSEDQNEIQPIYKAMAKIGYDAITLGNHEFDYGYEYLLKQLNGSGLRDITVVSNVVDSKTGEYPFLENMLITRTMKSADGDKVEVTVGIIGETIPTLTSKTHSYTGILKTEDMVLNVKTQAAKLKEMGADIIIALAHTGMGPEEPELNFKNVAYALTKIPEVDVVISGHEHNLFPTTDSTSPYLKLPGVDKQTFLVNGKNVVMAGDRGEAIGVVDLTLEVVGDEVTIVDRSSEVRMVNEKNTTENKTIASGFGKWEDELLEYSTEILAEVDPEVSIQNFYGMMGDNTAIQLLNDSRMYYALNYINTTGKKYQDYPIVAASTYASFGVTNINDFINIKDEITESDLSVMQPYNNYMYLYTITGKQLKEWLEWSASAYETTTKSVPWTNSTMAGLMNETNLKSLLKEEWLNDWSTFYVFDGVDYKIDPSVDPRYDQSGNRISDNRRITSVTYNGAEVTDSTKLIIACNKITQPQDANRGVEKQVALNGFVRTQSVLSKYINLLHKSGSIVPVIDDNWNVVLPTGYQFIAKAPFYGKDLVQKNDWFIKFLKEDKQYQYFTASYKQKSVDGLAPHIIIAPTKTGPTASEYEIAVNAFDESQIKSLRFLKGDFGTDLDGWMVAKVIDHSFTVYDNGTYTIYAEDIHGNKAVKKIVINNFREDMLDTPTVDVYTNRKTKISGKAEPSATIIFDAYTGTYETKVGLTGSYSYSLPAQPSGSTVYVYVRNEAGMESERAAVTVKRTGPNQPDVNPINNNIGYITGTTNDTDATVIAIVDDTVYVSNKGAKDLFINAAEIYKEDYTIVETIVDVQDTGYFIMLIPPQAAGATVSVYNLDHVSRVSRVTSMKVEELAPNAPEVFEVSNIERSITGYVPNYSGKGINVTLLIGDHSYSTKSDEDGYFSFTFADQLHVGQIIKVFASDYKNGASRKSYETEVTVNDIAGYVKNSSYLQLGRMTNKSTYIQGTYFEESMVYLAISEGEGINFTNTLTTIYPNDMNKLLYELDHKLAVGTKIYVMSRLADGKIRMVAMTEVVAGIPDQPSLVTSLTNTAKTVEVISEKDCEITLTIGDLVYRTKEYKYSDILKQYIYTLPIDRVLSGTDFTIVATNGSGSSEIFKSKVIKAAPELPQVNTIYAGDTKITGKIELLDYTTANESSILAEANAATGTVSDAGTTSTDEKADKEGDRFKDAPSKVAKTQTRIFATIGSKTYEGTIDNKGNFTIEIPKQKEGKAIKVFGMNKAGRGPLVVVKVVKAQ
ncbi:MAG: hypothetical protein K0S47_4236 [Herbinix sp.]|jgi:2',3'-cyclic-nucleotide 2'-phosphodiesterase/3'-nucleotidase|nr:hypothetical protein [Herbinix sp.]